MSFIPVIIEWMKSGGKIGGMPLEKNHWFNLGSRKEYLSAHRIIARDGWVPDYLRGGPWPIQVDPSAEISLESRVEGASYLGARCKIEGNVLVEDSILFPGSFVPCNTTLRSCIVAGAKIDPGVYVEIDFI
jgi:mannose-1-phosphate guanylyltransferase